MRLPLLIALASAAPLVAQTLPKRQLVEEVRLDANIEDFPDVGSVLVNTRGDMAVFISKDQQLRFYDAAGKKLGTFGRKGSGPSEFQNANMLGWIGDTLWLYDVSLRRVTYISPARQLLRSELLNPSLNRMGGVPVGSPAPASRPTPPTEGAIAMFAPRGIVGDRYVGMGVIMKGKLPDGRQDSKSVVVAVPRPTATGTEDMQLIPAGDTVDSHATAIIADWPIVGPNRLEWSRADGRGSASAVIPFTFSPVTAYAPDGTRIAYMTVEPSATGGTYTVKMMRSTGGQLFTRAYAFTGIPIPRAVADSVMEHFGQQPDGRQMFQPEAIQLFKEQLPAKMPKFYSPVSRLHLGANNTTWIQMRRPDPKSPAAMVLLDERGNQVATFDLPPKHTVMFISRDQLWAQVTDDDDLPSVVRYRIR